MPASSSRLRPHRRSSARPWYATALAAGLATLLGLAGCSSSTQNAPPRIAIGEPVAELELPGLGPAGDYDTTELNWKDTTRNREVPALLYWPAAQPIAGDSPTVPLIVFSHGIGGSRFGYSYLGRYWASHGFASLHVQHVGSDRSLWSSSTIESILHLREAAQEKEAIARVADLRFALDSLLASERGPRIDRQRIIAAGHSYGANTALLAAGATVEREGKPVKFRDPRFTAAILISAPPFYGEDDFGPILREVSIPTLHVTATEDVITIPGYHSPMSDRVRVFDATGSQQKVLAVFQGGSHSVFTDRNNTGGENAPRMKVATQALSLAFLRRVFDGNDDALRAWGSANRGLVAQYVSR